MLTPMWAEAWGSGGELARTESVVAGSSQHCVIEASHAVASGACRYALAFRGLYNPVGRRYGSSSPAYPTAEGRGRLGPGWFRGPYGIFAPGSFAHYAQRHMDLYGGTREQMAEFASKNRDRALQWVGEVVRLLGAARRGPAHRRRLYDVTHDLATRCASTIATFRYRPAPRSCSRTKIARTKNYRKLVEIIGPAARPKRVSCGTRRSTCGGPRRRWALPRAW